LFPTIQGNEMKINKPLPSVTAKRTAEGAVASKINHEQELRRLTATGMLWEDGFYVSGKTVAARIAELIPHCRPDFVAACAVEARNVMKLRHMPLHIVREMARGSVAHRLLVAKLLPDVIQRADELTEFLAIYWKDGKQPISAQVKKGLAKAFPKFNEYALAKYNRDGAVKLRDVAFLTHVKPTDPDLMARLVNKGTIPTHTKGGHEIWPNTNPKIGAKTNPGLETPDTWEVELSANAGEGKKESWERLLREQKLGGLAYLRNLRNMTQAGVSEQLIKEYVHTVNIDRVLPFRFIAAARVVPQFESFLEPLMLSALKDRPKFAGRTALLVDISGSMNSRISAKSDLNRLDAACGVAMLLRELCEDIVIGRFDTKTELVPPRRGFALRDAIGQTRGGTSLRQAVAWATDQKYDRIIVLTDEQSTDRPAAPLVPGRGYVINVAANSQGVGYGPWNHIDGWSEGVIDYIHTFEQLGIE
jgi:hypothetical protein